MPITKPNLISAGASMHGVKRAREGSANRGMAQNAALGLDSFSRLLNSDSNASRSPIPLAPGSGAGISGANSDILKAAGLENGQMFMPGGHNNLRNMSAIQKAMQESSQPLAMATGLRSINSMRPSGSEAAVLSMKSAAHRVKDAAQAAAEKVSAGVGKLSGLFESGRDGVAAIGHDKVGGTSYGTYQIASNTGTFDEFLKFLDKHSPDYAKELRAAGKANTGSKQGAVPDAWRSIAGQDPDGFGKLQHDFIQEKLYNVTVGRIGEHGIDETKLSPTMREVLFSTAVQHGPGGAARIVRRAMSEADVNALMSPDGMPGADKARTEEQVIKRIYGIRQEQFASSTPRVQQAVNNRLNSEMQMALNMLKTGHIG